MQPGILCASLFFSVNRLNPLLHLVSQRGALCFLGCGDPHCEGAVESECLRAGACARLLGQPLPGNDPALGNTLIPAPHGRREGFRGHAWRILWRKCIMKATPQGTQCSFHLQYLLLQTHWSVSPGTAHCFLWFPHIHQLPFCVWDISYLDGEWEEAKPMLVCHLILNLCFKDALSSLAKWGLITNKILCVISYLIFLSDYFILERLMN